MRRAFAVIPVCFLWAIVADAQVKDPTGDNSTQATQTIMNQAFAVTMKACRGPSTVNNSFTPIEGLPGDMNDDVRCASIYNLEFKCASLAMEAGDLADGAASGVETYAEDQNEIENNHTATDSGAAIEGLYLAEQAPEGTSPAALELKIFAQCTALIAAH